jgi:signal transduction histidine kinase
MRGGSGLGLSIVAAIVEAHGGTVTASSAPGQGMTVSVRIPNGADVTGSDAAPAGAVGAPVQPTA